MEKKDLPEMTQRILQSGSVRIRVNRTGMFQQLTFLVKRVKTADIEFTELFTERMVDIVEVERVAEEVGLPVEAKNGRAFPKGKTASDFQNIH